MKSDEIRKDDIDKRDNGLLVPLEQWMGRTALPFVPQAMTANHVTMLSGTAGLAAGLAFYLASFHAAWFAAGALLVLVQWWADNTDGHVARTRRQASPAGRFLDIFLDCCSFTALGVGLSFASYTQFPIVALATMLCLLQYVLTVLWIALARIWPFPAFGPGEASLTLIVMALVMPFVPRHLITIAGLPLSLIDLAFAATIPSTLVALIVSSRQLFRHLQQSAPAPPVTV
jgi:phosphatidylglycerophosphate synthase